MTHAFVKTLRGYDSVIFRIPDDLATGLDRQQDATEQGLVLAASGNVRYLASAEPAAWASAIQGKPIEILFYGATEWTRARVHGRMPMAGAVRLTVTAEFENQ